MSRTVRRCGGRLRLIWPGCRRRCAVNTGNQTSASATIDQSVQLPNLFGCDGCPAQQWAGKLCVQFKAEGLCRAAILARAVELGAVRIVLHLGGGDAS